MNLSFESTPTLLSKVDLSVPRPVVDLSAVNFLDPFALVYLGMYLRYHSAGGKRFTVVPPRSAEAREYLARQNFWERFNFDPASVERERLLRLSSRTSFRDIVDIERTATIADEVAERALRILRSEPVIVDRSLVAETVGELVDNFAQHSDSSLAACAMQYYPRARRVEFAIGDCGIGIRRSLSSNPDYAYLAGLPHEVAAAKAFEPLVSRRGEGGTGLTGIADEMLAGKGGLLLATGDGFVHARRGGIRSGELALDLTGVQILVAFATK